MKCLALTSLYLWTTTLLTSQISFQESAMSLGIDHAFQAWTVGGGISCVDFDLDGWDDLTLATENGREVAFFKNLQGEGFEKLAPLVQNQETVKQILWADYDNDGDQDLYLAAFDGINRLYENTGELNMVDVTSASGLPASVKRSYGAAWGDYNRDGWLDLYVSLRDLPGSPGFQNENHLYRNNADGTFSDVSVESASLDPGKIPFCSAFIDVNNDLWPDIYTANDRYSRNTMLLNNSDGTFSDIGQIAMTDIPMNAMCVTPVDFNRDGKLDIYVTNTAEGSVFLVNQGVPPLSSIPQFEDRAENLGIGFNGIGWGSCFLDADNDSDMDLYVSGSIRGTERPSSAFYENYSDSIYNKVLHGGFEGDTVVSYTNAIGDFNGDGRIDIVTQNNPPDPFFLFINNTFTENNWLKINLEGVVSNRDGVGTFLECFATDSYQMHYSTCGIGFLGQNSSSVHFGLGADLTVDSIRITWPSGHKDILENILANQTVSIVEGESTAGVISIDNSIVIIPRPNTTSTIETFTIPGVSVFPNPFGNILHIYSDEVQISGVELLTIDGRLLMSKQTSGKDIQIPIPDLPAGMYSLKIEADNKMHVEKIFHR